MTHDPNVEPNVAVTTLFENIINALKNGKAKEAGDLPKYAIDQYYSKGDKHFDLLRENFIDEYVDHESTIEGVHNNIEKEGLKAVYEFIFSNSNDQDIDINFIKQLHKILYSKAPFPEAGGKFRTEPARLNGAVISICPWENIEEEMQKTNKWVNKIIKESAKIQENYNIDNLFAYIEECLKLNCHLIQIHPFFDGNGRTIRAFTNKLFILAGIPPIYIHPEEKKHYHIAMEKAITQNDFSSITHFYHIKICQSIYELGINPNHELKTRTTIKKIKKVIEHYKVTSEDITSNISDLTITYSESIKRELENEKIPSKIFIIENSIGEEYRYLISCIKNETKSNKILIDPLFSNEVVANNLYINPNMEHEDRILLTTLFKEGVVQASDKQIDTYIQIVNPTLNKKDKPRQKILK